MGMCSGKEKKISEDKTLGQAYSSEVFVHQAQIDLVDSDEGSETLSLVACNAKTKKKKQSLKFQ